MSRTAADGDPELEGLVKDLIDERLDEAGAQRLRERLAGSPEARAYYRAQVGFHAQMRWLLGSPGSTSAEDRRETEALFRRRGERARTWRGVAAVLFAGALTAALLVISFDPGAGVARGDTGAILAQASGARWVSGSPVPELGDELLGQIYSLREGFARLDIGPGVQMFIEGPCRFEPVSPMLVRVHEGRVNVEVNEEGHGFTIWTEAGDFIDLGTRFGVGVGRDRLGNPVVMSEVFDGEVKVTTRQGSGSTSEILVEGEARGLIGEGDYVSVSRTIDEKSIQLQQFSRYEQTTAIERYRSQDAYNVALGKPVFGYGSFVWGVGEVFPVAKVTDGRVNDTGVPGNWSFWLAPDGQPLSAVVIDLGEPLAFDCVQLLNTRNRHHGDRGTRDFQLFVSVHGKIFHRVGGGRLPRIESELRAESSPPTETYVFQPVRARFVKVLVTSHYTSGGPRPRYRGAGLNEVRVFPPSMPSELRAEIVDGAHPLPQPSPDDGNIALGKPATGSPCYGDGSVFHWGKVVDGLVDDVFIGDRYSCWLTPEEDTGHFVIDLGEPRELDRVELQNTANGGHIDRGTRDYQLLLSEDGSEFQEVASGTLERVGEVGAPFVPVSLGGERARFIKFVAKSHYGRGAGLSELRAYASPPAADQQDRQAP